jgi:lysyl-tRNA synthetase class 2
MNQDATWKPAATLERLHDRARCMALIRDFFNSRGYLEVETPIMARFGVTDRYLANIQARFRGVFYALQTSPEYHMKRLIAAGSGPIYQLARVFRDDELGRWHNPEFTLLEWYQLGIDHHALMDEVDLLLQTIVHSKPLVKKTYEQAFFETCDLNPFTDPIARFKDVLGEQDLDRVLDPDETDRDQYLFLLMSHVVEPALGRLDTPVAVHAFPPSQAALAQVRNGVAERFEVYFKGVELANGFHELTDANAQAKRFEADKKLRAQAGLPDVQADVYLLAALKQGMPQCSGVALGVDRLLALALEQDNISSVLAFDFSRA